MSELEQKPATGNGNYSARITSYNVCYTKLLRFPLLINLFEDMHQLLRRLGVKIAGRFIGQDDIGIT